MRGKTPHRRCEFTDAQKAEMFVRDRALCSYSGKSLWVLDYGGGPGTSDWADHIVPACKGGRAELENGASASWLFNKLKAHSSNHMRLFEAGRPTEDFFTFYEKIPRQIADHLRRFSTLHFSDWYFNRAISHVRMAAATQGETKQNGQPLARGLDYRARAVSKRLMQWSKLVARERPGTLASRRLLPRKPSTDQQILLRLTTDFSLNTIKEVALEIVPYYKASWYAMIRLANVNNKAKALKLLDRVEKDKFVVPRVKDAIRHNIECLYL